MSPESRSCSLATDRSPGRPLPDDPGAQLEALFRRHGPLVRRAVRAVLRGFAIEPDPDRVDDLEQDVWCRLLERQHLRRPGPRQRFEGETVRYLRRVAESAVVDALRAASADKRRPPGLIGLEECRGPGMRVEDRRGDPERGLLAREELRGQLALWRSQLGKRDLPVRLRIVRLAWIDGLSSPEIARRVGRGWTQSGIDSLLLRLRRRLDRRGERAPVRGASR